MTPCKHLYHPKCLWEWSSKREVSCPLCKRQELNPVRYYCPRCGWNYIEIPLAGVPEACRKDKWQTCIECGEHSLDKLMG